jgi:dipeptide/tripeptide permease
MIPGYARKSLVVGIPGLVIQAGCVAARNSLLIAAAQNPSASLSTGTLILLQIGTFIGSVLFIIGLCFYAKAKGYHSAWGLIGLLSCIGLLILALFPDKTKNQNPGS